MFAPGVGGRDLKQKRLLGFERHLQGGSRQILNLPCFQMLISSYLLKRKLLIAI